MSRTEDGLNSLRYERDKPGVLRRAVVKPGDSAPGEAWKTITWVEDGEGAGRGWRFAYLGLTVSLVLIWASIAAFAAVYVGLALGDNAQASNEVTPPSVAQPVLRPKPVGAPDAATRMTDFDTGVPKQHLFYYIGCTNGILAVVTTDEIVLAEWPCEGVSIAAEDREPFQGKPVRITVVDHEYLSVESPGIGKFEFNVDSAWLVTTSP